MDNQQNMNPQGNNQNANQGQVDAPSIYALACPKCNSKDYRILGAKGGKGQAIGMGMALGAVGSLISNSMNKDDFSIQPMRYKCNACKNKFEAMPFKATPDELLDAPCTVHFKRLSRFTGMAVSQHVWINGVKAGVVGNGKEISFPTYTKHNTVFVTDQYGVAFKGDYKFEAVSGGNVEIRFKGKFV